MSHRALTFTGPAEPLQLTDRPTPKPGPGQVLVKNLAVALNPVDYVVHHLGIWVDHYGYPALTGMDGAGTIAAIGEGVQGWNVGDRVYVVLDWSTATWWGALDVLNGHFRQSVRFALASRYYDLSGV